MTNLQPKCYNCEKEMDTHPPYFCSEKCKLEYWHESPDKPQEKRNKTIPEIQAGLARLAREAKPLEPEVDGGADFFESISNNSNAGVGSTPLPAKVSNSRQRSYPDSYL